MNSTDLETLTIIKYPDPRLRQPCAPVESFDDDLKALVARMLELMKNAEGVGLAAPQVGISRRLFVCNITGESGDAMAFVNPQLADFEGDESAEEGCLSIPEVNVTVKRAKHCRIDACDLDGNPIAYEGTDLAARCWQHECDHLDGRLIIDRMSAADRIANRRALKRLDPNYK